MKAIDVLRRVMRNNILQITEGTLAHCVCGKLEVGKEYLYTEEPTYGPADAVLKNGSGLFFMYLLEG